MKHSNLTKAITLLFFIGMITTLILYRMGMFDKKIISETSIHQSPNGSVLTTAANDTTIKPKKIIIKRKPRMSSSKTFIATDDVYIFQENDTPSLKKSIKNLQQEYRKKTFNDSAKKTEHFFSGSKSGAIFKTSDVKLSDSLFTPYSKFDTTTRKKPNKNTKQ